jgi:putative membrane protein insertion efficiency factor
MPSLRSVLKRPHLWLALGLVLAVAASIDSGREPGRQITALGYIQAVRAYQILARPLIRPWVRCRYQPSCSQYSIDAVKQFGIRAGLLMTLRRIARCTMTVPPGTVDPAGGELAGRP